MKSEQFHLYGMRFTTYGDVEKARELVGQARKMNFQRDLSSVPMLTANNPDGSQVRVINQAGQDFVIIYVPVVESPGDVSIESVIEETYIPAFEVTDIDGLILGWVLARGVGWQGPYEFIPKTEMSQEDLFWWSQWLYGDDPECPFNDLDEFLTHKLLYQDQIDNVVRTFWDVPANGVQNRIFDVAYSVTDEHQTSMDDPSCTTCCRSDGEENYYYVSVEAPFYTSSHTVTKSNFTLDPCGETGEYLKDLGDTVYSFDPYVYTKTSSKTGYKSFHDGGGRVSMGGGSCEELAEPGKLGNYTCDDFLAEWPAEDEDDYNWHDYELIAETQNVDTHDYSTHYSSAEDADHYAFGYVTYGSTSINSEIVTTTGDCNEALADPVNTSTTTEQVQEFKIILSGSVFIVTEYTQEELTNFRLLGTGNRIAIRYYHMGSLEVALGIIIENDIYTIDSGRERYFIGGKQGNEISFDSSLVFTESNFCMIFPDLKGLDGQDLYLSSKFRLIKERKVTEET